MNALFGMQIKLIHTIHQYKYLIIYRCLLDKYNEGKKLKNINVYSLYKN